MFHDGDLQSGIALAIQQAKSVACFVRDESEESDKWEKEWLMDEQTKDLLARTTVLLRLQAGTQEAGFLAAFCPLSNIPTFVVIKNGQVLEFLTAGVEHSDFKSRLEKALGAGDDAAHQPDNSQTAPPPVEVPAPAPPVASSQPGSSPTPAPARAVHPTPAPSAKPASTPKKEEEEDKPLSAKAKGKQKEESKPTGVDQQKKVSAAAEARQKKLAEKQELERVQALIEADKVARRKRREEEKAARRAAQETATPPTATPPRPTAQRAVPAGQKVNLQVRLFDGSTLRSSFPVTATLSSDVRPWVDQSLKSSPEAANFPPYNFKQILAPQPSRNIDVSDEVKPIGHLDLYPSATLVLVPVSEFTEAYSAAGGHGILGMAYRGISGLWGIGTGAVGMVGGALGSITGYGAASPEQQQQQQSASTGPPTREPSPKTPPSAGSAKIRVRTLADQRAESGNQNEEWYNGNQLNFEPNKDDNDK